MVDNTRYKDAFDGLLGLENAYDKWTAKLTEISIQLSFALIAANWAVHGEGIKSLLFPRLSIACAFLSIATSLIAAKLMVTAHDAQHEYAESDPVRWTREWSRAKTASTPWPYTIRIEKIGEVTREFRFWLPIVGCVFLGLSIV